MRIAVDSNCIIAALIKDGVARQIILRTNHEFFINTHVLHEINKHQEHILRRSGCSLQEINSTLDVLLRRIMIVQDDSLISVHTKAYETMKNIDPDDILILACALAIKADFIWSDDKHFLLQKLIPVKTTEEMME